MNKNLNFIITLFAIVYIAFQMLDVFSGSDPANNTRTRSRSYINATGMEVSLSDYTGNYLWVDYAAEWCSYCEPQTRTLKGLEEKYGDKLTFLTVVTGTGTVMEPPTADTAMNWARRFDLDTNKVLAYFSTNRLPYHILYSPSGTILFQGSGLYNAGKITNVLNTHTSLFD
jgi:thiol-disulfide isomerase/thioredoxin